MEDLAGQLEDTTMASMNTAAQRRALARKWSEPCFFLHLHSPGPICIQPLEVGGIAHELQVWLPGPHPRDATWCEELSAWVRVRAA